jgi:hypothetical protein
MYTRPQDITEFVEPDEEIGRGSGGAVYKGIYNRASSKQRVSTVLPSPSEPSNTTDQSTQVVIKLLHGTVKQKIVIEKVSLLFLLFDIKTADPLLFY